MNCLLLHGEFEDGLSISALENSGYSLPGTVSKKVEPPGGTYFTLRFFKLWLCRSRRVRTGASQRFQDHYNVFTRVNSWKWFQVGFID
jgi:hypothetical protein